MRLKHLIIINLFFFFMLFCCTMTIENIPIQPIHNYKFSKTTDNFLIGIQPYYKKNESKKYFGRYLLADGILPILIVIKNISPESSYIVNKDLCKLGELKTESDTTGSRT